MAEEILSSQKVEEAEVFSWWNSNKKTHLASFAKRYLSPPSSSVHSKRLFSEAGNLYNKSEIGCFQNRQKTVISSAQLLKTMIGTFVD